MELLLYALSPWQPCVEPPSASLVEQGRSSSNMSSSSSQPAPPDNVERRSEVQHGLELWHTIDQCVVLTYSHRSQGPLQDILSEMRAGRLSARSRALLQDRLLQPHDPRLLEPLFWEPDCVVGVLRHNTRAMACMQRAQQLAARAGQRLVVVLAADRAQSPKLASRADLAHHFLHTANLSTTSNLPGMLFLWRGCRLCLEENVAAWHAN